MGCGSSTTGSAPVYDIKEKTDILIEPQNDPVRNCNVTFING